MTASSVPLPAGIELRPNRRMSRLTGVTIWDIYRPDQYGVVSYQHAWVCESIGEWWFQTVHWTGPSRPTQEEALNDWVVPFVINKMEV